MRSSKKCSPASVPADVLHHDTLLMFIPFAPPVYACGNLIGPLLGLDFVWEVLFEESHQPLVELVYSS